MMKGHAARWSPSEISAQARFDGSAVVAVVDWYRTVVSGPAADLILASGNLPTVAVFSESNAQPPSNDARLAALSLFASRALQPPFTWSEPLRFYLDASSLPVPWSLVRLARDSVQKAAVSEAQAVSQGLVSGKVPIGKWQSEMASITKMAHGSAACLTLGGWSSVDQMDWLRVSSGLEFQLGYLDGFAQALEKDTFPVDGHFWSRVSQYPRSLRKTWFSLTGLEMVKRGYDLEMNLLGGTESCEECLEMSDLGWVRQGTLIDIGSRQCLNFCDCEIQYASSFTGATWQDELST